MGTVISFGGSTAPTGFLVANGEEVGRSDYPELFAVIGTTYGAGDGDTTFNLPNLIGRFQEGSMTPGTYKGAGLPNIVGTYYTIGYHGETNASGAITYTAGTVGISGVDSGGSYKEGWGGKTLTLNASTYNSIYGNSSTVQPPALTLLPCIKAFNAED